MFRQKSSGKFHKHSFRFMVISTIDFLEQMCYNINIKNNRKEANEMKREKIIEIMKKLNKEELAKFICFASELNNDRSQSACPYPLPKDSAK